MRQKWEGKRCMEKQQKQRENNATWHASMQSNSDARGKPMEDVHMHKHEGASGLIRISQCLRTGERNSRKEVR